MGTKLTPKVLERVRKLSAQDMSSREIAETLTRELRKPVSRSSVSSWLAGKGAKVSPPPTPAKKPKARAVSAPPAAPLPVDDDAAMTPEDMFAALGALMRSQDRLSRKLAAEGDHVGAQKAVRLVVQLGGILAKQSKEDDEDDHVRVKAEEMSAASDRAVASLHRIVDGVQAERATWPRCATCGQPRGEFPHGDKSTLRALVERFFGKAAA